MAQKGEGWTEPKEDRFTLAKKLSEKHGFKVQSEGYEIDKKMRNGTLHIQIGEVKKSAERFHCRGGMPTLAELEMVRLSLRTSMILKELNVKATVKWDDGKSVEKNYKFTEYRLEDFEQILHEAEDVLINPPS
ncbi:MAG: hypothetical protein L6408_00160 [Nanoarchaeota archaeon]|nr:hypothetical protein [Nanoarchaeota archaeon]